MKLPALFGALVATGSRAIARVRSGVGRIPAKLGSLFSGINDTTRKIVGVAVVGAAGLVTVIVLFSLVFTRPVRSPADTGPGGEAPPTAGSGAPWLDIPDSGPALASRLLIPGHGEVPLPLALEPKARYTEAEAAAVRPILGDIDVSGMTRRRKAELEAIFSAVD
ncbi:MAG: hypothetical protein JXM71_09540 [Spirochaetales bacterium]|nr:hypothetical protein [Spirochaetales bacterium]